MLKVGKKEEEEKKRADCVSLYNARIFSSLVLKAGGKVERPPDPSGGLLED